MAFNYKIQKFTFNQITKGLMDAFISGCLLQGYKIGGVSIDGKSAFVTMVQ